MTSDQCDEVQCFVFIINEGQENSAASLSLESGIQGYALIPPALIACQETKIHQLLSRNGLRLLDDEDICPSLTSDLTNDLVEMVEFRVVGGAETRAPDSPDVLVFANAHEVIYERVKQILSEGACVKRNAGRFLCSQNAFDEENHSIIDKLLAFNANIRYVHWLDGTFLHYATTKATLEPASQKLVRLSLFHGANVNATRNDGRTALHIAAKKGDESLVELLLQYGANVNPVVSSSGLGSKTPLHWAVLRQPGSTVELLLKHGANVDAVDSTGATALLLAVEKEWLHVTKLILRYRPSVQVRGNVLALCCAICKESKRSKKFVYVLLKYGFSVGAEDVENSKLMHDAVEKGYVDVVSQLLELGAESNIHKKADAKCHDSGTPLLTAVLCDK